MLALGLAWLPAEAIVLLSLRQTVALVGAVRAHESYAPIVRFFWHRPALLVVLTFLALGLGGGLVLTFPVCSTRPISGLDALFTAVSACCVTGLTVLDTPVDCTFVGQLVILDLIQAGGLGVMTLAAIAVMILGGALPSEEEAALGHVVGTTTPGSTARLVRVIALGTFCVEVVGAAILLPAFLAEGSSFLDALWKAVFHAVSAFCNAGATTAPPRWPPCSQPSSSLLSPPSGIVPPTTRTSCCRYRRSPRPRGRS